VSGHHRRPGLRQPELRHESTRRDRGVHANANDESHSFPPRELGLAIPAACLPPRPGPGESSNDDHAANGYRKYENVPRALPRPAPASSHDGPERTARRPRPQAHQRPCPQASRYRHRVTPPEALYGIVSMDDGQRPRHYTAFSTNGGKMAAPVDPGLNIIDAIWVCTGRSRLAGERHLPREPDPRRPGPVALTPAARHPHRSTGTAGRPTQGGLLAGRGPGRQRPGGLFSRKGILVDRVTRNESEMSVPRQAGQNLAAACSTCRTPPPVSSGLTPGSGAAGCLGDWRPRCRSRTRDADWFTVIPDSRSGFVSVRAQGGRLDPGRAPKPQHRPEAENSPAGDQPEMPTRAANPRPSVPA
jgi:hypothetical protein